MRPCVVNPNPSHHPHGHIRQTFWSVGSRSSSTTKSLSLCLSMFFSINHLACLKLINDHEIALFLAVPSRMNTSPSALWAWPDCWRPRCLAERRTLPHRQPRRSLPLSRWRRLWKSTLAQGMWYYGWNFELGSDKLCAFHVQWGGAVVRIFYFQFAGG